MARATLASMSVEALLKMRDKIGAVLSSKAEALKKELRSIASDHAEVGRITANGRIAGRKVPPKYRGPNGETWAGRGAQPRWLTTAIKNGKKREDFLIAKPAQVKRISGKKQRGRKKLAKKAA